MKWLDLFAGHGVGVAMKELDIEELAVERWQDAIDSRLANGLSEPAYRDAWDIENSDVFYFDGLWASPPCQTFSTAGTGSGRKALDDVLDLIASGVWKTPDGLRQSADRFEDPRTGLVLTPLAYAHRHRPLYVVLEQVTPVLPVWEAFAGVLGELGYSTWTGVLDAADYGVPQNRRRAYLIARRDGRVASAPEKSERIEMLSSIRPDQEGLVSNYSSGSGGITVPGNKKARGYRRIDQPAFTVTGKVRANKWFPSGERVSPEEALKMQSYPGDFILKGDWSLQVGNAVPPRLAKAVLEMFL